MSDDKPNIDPEVLAIMKEVIADPSSTLVRMPRVKCGKLLGLRDRKISVGEAFLSSAERHLLQRYRDEVGYLLLEASRALLASRGFENTRIHYPEAVSAPDRSRTTRVSEYLRDRVVVPELDFLKRSYLPTDHPSPSELARAAIRVYPSDRGRIELALCLNAEGRAPASLGALRDVAIHHPSRASEACAFANLGFVNAGLQNFGLAQVWYRRGGLAGETIALVYWFIFAIRAGDETEALESANRLEDALDPTDPRLGAARRALIADQKAGDWFPARRSSGVRKRITERLPPIARSIADVIS